MKTRAKAMTVMVAMVTTFAILPTLGAAAAEPLPDGSYEVSLAGTTYTVEVVDGVPVVDEVDGVTFTFAFDDDGRVLDEFDASVDGIEYDVEVDVAEDGSAFVVAEPVGVSDGDPQEFVDVEEPEAPVEDVEVEETDVEEPEADEEEAEEDGAHGELVSSVAHCAPSGKVAREAGLPNHGAFVSAAAKGEVLEFEVDGEAYSADLSTPEGAAALCTLVEELLAAAEEPEVEEGESSEGADTVEETETEKRGNGNGNGNGKGRDNAPGQQKKND